MSSEVERNLSAEDSFAAAFERLKKNRSEILPKGSAVTQNNVAREAGRDPSALRKSRFPKLIAQIQAFRRVEGAQRQRSKTERIDSVRRRNCELQVKLEALKRQRDEALGLLAEADARIVELTMENLRLSGLLPNAQIIALR